VGQRRQGFESGVPKVAARPCIVGQRLGIAGQRLAGASRVCCSAMVIIQAAIVSQGLDPSTIGVRQGTTIKRQSRASFATPDPAQPLTDEGQRGVLITLPVIVALGARIVNFLGKNASRDRNVNRRSLVADGIASGDRKDCPIRRTPSVRCNNSCA